MAAGGERVTLSLLSMPKLKVRTYISVLPAAIKQRMKDEMYQEYISESLRIIGENTAKYVNGQYLKVKFSEIVNPRPEETRTSDEVINYMKEKITNVGR